MRKLIVPLLVVVIGLARPALAQSPVERIAYDSPGCVKVGDETGWYPYCWPAVVSETVDKSSRLYAPTDYEGADALEPAWSPDGTRIAFRDLWAGGRVAVWDLENGTLVNLPSTAGGARAPTWSPDGRQIAFRSDPTGIRELYVMQADGSGISQITYNVGFAGAPAWSPDGSHIAFDCEFVNSNTDICVIDIATGQIVRLTTDLGSDLGAAWSPDGSKLAFATQRYTGISEIAIMNADGSAVRRLGVGTAGLRPAWSPDGRRIAFEAEGGYCYDFDGYVPLCLNSIYLINADGSGQMFFEFGFNPAWASTTVPLGKPITSFQYVCTNLTCTFQSTSLDPDGTIVTYAWDFGDGSSGAGTTQSHTYAVAGSYAVRLTVTDNNGLQSSKTQTVTPRIPPVASFVFTCIGLTCNFDGSGSSDSDGSIVSYVWRFSDQTTSSGPLITHAFPKGGDYNIVLTVTDNDGVASQQFRNITVKALMHVGDLDSSSMAFRDTWTANGTITIHDEYHRPVYYATVIGAWSTEGPASCVTNESGQCTVTADMIPRKIGSATYTVGNLEHSWGTYEAVKNHDPDGDSSGNSITINRP